MTDDYWEKRDRGSAVVVLGDGDGHVDTVAGLLKDIVPDEAYEGQVHYVLIDAEGEETHVAGSASIRRELDDRDLGEFIQLTFEGWAKSAQGRRFKAITVKVWGGPAEKVPPKLKKWPRFAEVWRKVEPRVSTATREKETTAQPPAGRRGLDAMPEALEAEDDLPF